MSGKISRGLLITRLASAADVGPHGLDTQEAAILKVFGERTGQGKKTCHLSYNRLAHEAKMSRREAVYTIKRLTKRELIKITTERICNTYRINLKRLARLATHKKYGRDAKLALQRYLTGTSTERATSARRAPGGARRAPALVQDVHQGGANGAPERPLNVPVERPQNGRCGRDRNQQGRADRGHSSNGGGGAGGETLKLGDAIRDQRISDIFAEVEVQRLHHNDNPMVPTTCDLYAIAPRIVNPDYA